MTHSAEGLIERSIPFLQEIRNRTAGGPLERWLNRVHGPGTPVYDDLAAIITAGVADGWAAADELDGCRYRRGRIASPQERLEWFSITAVYMDSVENFRGQYHQHPYGEVNMVVPLTPGATLMGPNGWQGPGWTAPAPGSHHYPEIRGGALIALFFLPAGRISYDITPTPEDADPAV